MAAAITVAAANTTKREFRGAKCEVRSRIGQTSSGAIRDESVRQSGGYMKSIAILGASADRSKYGNKAVRAYLQQGYTVYPINPKESQIEGLRVYRSALDLPERPGRVSVYLPPAVLQTVLDDVAARGCDELWLNPGSESDAVLARAAALGLNVFQACSIVDVGVNPHAM